MKYILGFLLIAIFASCEKQIVDLNIEIKPIQSSKIGYFYSKVYTTNNHSPLQMDCDLITIVRSNDTLMAKVKLYKSTDDFTLITAIVTDTNSANITQFTDYMPASLPSTATKQATGKVIFNTTSCDIDIIYLSGNSQQFIGQ